MEQPTPKLLRGVSPFKWACIQLRKKLCLQAMATGLQIQGESRVQGSVLPELVVTATGPMVGRESPDKDVAPPSPSALPVVLKSNLHKKGKRFKGWHQRYFEIQGQHMYYYKNHTKMDCLGEIDLSLCIHCDVTDEATFGAPFEISTTLRTHVLSARSVTERDQWIQAVRSQMEAGRAKTTLQTKPKRWRTFRNHFKRQPKVQNPTKSKITKRKSIMERLRLRRPAPLKVDKDPNVESRQQHRPLSLTDEQVPMDALEVLLDAMPSVSLPATPLTKKRSETVNYSPPISPMFAEPVVSPTMSMPVLSSSDSLGKEISVNGSNEDVMEAQNHDSPVTPECDALTHSAKEVQGDVDINQETMSFLKESQEIGSTWEKIREVLQVSYLSQSASSDMLQSEDQGWMDHSSGLEQLRAFLAVCD